MAGYRATKGLLTKLPTKMSEHIRETSPSPSSSQEPSIQDSSEAEAAVNCSLMDTFFATLWTDNATLQEEVAADIKEVKQEVTELRQRVDKLDQTSEAKEEELEYH
ncbi:hypothetical protein NDU88_003940 [Pleurodeles waltl]|uniref:Uncharacterized protein n=1 Tax=Pleurodeles waltl TaxID=8319 RepID=A0AAV7RJL7_PLEWA|nr:hypothetical protein NDU88_003940 [Pleurodeles waltl]